MQIFTSTTVLSLRLLTSAGQYCNHAKFPLYTTQYNAQFRNSCFRSSAGQSCNHANFHFTLYSTVASAQFQKFSRPELQSCKFPLYTTLLSLGILPFSSPLTLLDLCLPTLPRTVTQALPNGNAIGCFHHFKN